MTPCFRSGTTHVLFLVLALQAPSIQCGDGEDLPIKPLEEKHPDCLRLWHLYQDQDRSLAVGNQLTFIGEYNAGSDSIRLCQPPWVMVTYPVFIQWRITFHLPVAGHSHIRHEYAAFLSPEQVAKLMKRDEIRAAFERARAGVKGPGKPAGAGLFSLKEIYGDAIPLEFRDVDTSAKIVRLTFENLDKEGSSTCQCFSLKLDQPLLSLRHREYAWFTGEVQLNRPELLVVHKLNNEIPVFKIALKSVKLIHVERYPNLLQEDFPGIVKKAEPRLRGLCQKYHLRYQLGEKEDTAASWYANCIAITCLATAKPPFSFAPVPYATVTVLFEPATGKPKGIMFVRRSHQDPRD